MPKKPRSEKDKKEAFRGLQQKWYAKLKKRGFHDIEYPPEMFSEHDFYRTLKRYSGIVLKENEMVGLMPFQPPLMSAQSSFIESNIKEADDFQHRKEFDYLCERICLHGNSRLTPKKIKKIWWDYCSGVSTRAAEIKYRVSDTTIVRTINRIREWMSLMNTKQDNDETTTIISRAFDPETDTALIYATWRNSLWFDEKRDERGSGQFFTDATKMIRSILKRPTVSVRIACDKDSPIDGILGYSVIDGTNLEFVYVKVNFRKAGIATLLTKGITSWSKPATKIGRKIEEKKKSEICN